MNDYRINPKLIDKTMKMNNKKLISALAIVILMPFISFAVADDTVATGGSQSNAATVEVIVTSSPSTDGVNSNGATVDTSSGTAIPPTGGSDSNGATVIDSGTGVVVPPIGGQGSNGATIQESSGGGNTNTSSGGSSSYSSSGSRVSFLPVIQSTVSASTSCQLISNYMKQGWQNPTAEVIKLQMFLKNVEGLNVAVTGTFDDQTRAGVEAFQKKYISDVLGPWDATLPSGTVYITTLKKINQIACGASLTLNDDQSAIIAKHIQERDANTPAVSTEVGTTDNGQSVTSTESAPAGPTPVVGENEETNVAAVGQTSAAKRFWQFLKNIF